MHKIGIISDTHGLLRDEVKKELCTCDAIFHGGDINKQSILDELRAIAPLYAVRGNNDKAWAEALPRTLKTELFGVRFFMIHNRKQIEEDVGSFQVIIYGHTHKYAEQRQDGRLWLNPGSCGTRRFQSPVTMAVIEIKEDGSFTVQKRDFTVGAGVSLEQLPTAEKDREKLIRAVMKDTDRGRSVDEIAARQGIGKDLAEQICRLYVTHPGADALAIMNKMDLKRL